MTFEPWQWAVLATAAFLVGVSKSGIPGLGILFVAIFWSVIPGKAATGLVLPLLIVGDFAAMATYRRHALWKHVVRLMPWTIAGLAAGYHALGIVDDHAAARMVGAILLVMLAFHLWRSRKDRAEKLENEVASHATLLAPLTGIFAGFTTMVANAAGPVMVLYLLAMRLPKMEFLGTGAMFFLVMNLIKVPPMVHREMITPASLLVNAWLVPAVLLGSWAGPFVAARVSQKRFEQIALVLTFAAAIRMLVK